MLLRIMALVTAVVHMVSSQDRGGTILEQGSSSESQSVIVTARTRAFLSCESGDIVVRVNFTLPFRGLMYAHRSRTSPCRIHGTGDTYYELRIPLKGCGTWQESPRVFVNNITIRFHSALELEEDETKTVVCRYPPPLTQPPGTIQIIEPYPKTPTVSPTRVSTARLSEVEILILICLFLFLSLLTLGIGIAYFCLKRRNVRLVRHRKGTPSAPPSQLTRLSSSNRPPSSATVMTNRAPSSVLGHTVRIPRAVPYSAPPPGRTLSSAMSSSPFEEEDFRTSSSAEATSEETSPSTSSSEDQSRNLLYRKVGPKSILSIPKAILRSASANRWRTQQPAAVHQFITRGADGTAIKSRHHEREDQTVTTVLEPEIQFDEYSYYAESLQQSRAHSRATTQNSLPDTTSPVPVYAQVDKHKKTAAKQEATTLAKNLTGKPPLPPGHAKRRQVMTVTPEEHQTSEEVTKNTTVTTSVRREVKETKVSDPAMVEKLKDGKGLDKSLRVGKEEKSSILTTASQNLQKPPKSILIRDVSDVYLTTTVETELRELTTKVSKDIVEQHAKATIHAPPENVPSTSENVDVPFPDTRSWNVIIRHRSPDVSVEDPDASCESNGDSLEEPRQEPQFQVKIRAIPPDELQPKNQLMLIPPLEMPSAVGKLREVLQPPDQQNPPQAEEEEREPKDGVPTKQVRWTEDTKDVTCSTVSSSDSFQSSESLRERSSSEVLEVAPTLPSQQRKKDQPSMLERSTSEIVTSPEDHSRWVGGVVPVLESLSPEFLANIPVVVQGGFFNRQRSAESADVTKDIKKI